MIDPNITAHILSDERMRELGFTDHVNSQWYYVRTVGESTSFNLRIPKDAPAGFNIEVLDEYFLQHYDFASIDTVFARKVGAKVNFLLLKLQESGVISGYVEGNPATGVH